jgi:signal recognition particle subunit SRP54
MHRTMADVMKAMGSGAKRGPMAGLANMLGLGGMPSPEEMAKLAEKMPGGMPGMPGGLPPGFPGAPGTLPPMPGLPPKLPGGPLPGLGGKLPGLGGFPGLGKKK